MKCEEMQWLSGKVLDSIEGLQDQASLESLHCVLEQDTLSSNWLNPDMTEKLLTGM